MQLGLFTDIHFQPQGLDRIIKTGDWIIEEFKRQGIQAVVCMGDALVTREEVDVVAQSAAIHFFRRLADIWPVFLTLGNHDMNLKHSTAVSSLDGLDMHPKIKVFREITLVGDRFLFIPYHEDQSKIVQWVQDYARQNPEKAKNITVFGHLGLNGAVQNTKYGTTFAGAIGPDLFEPFKATYSGHFHVHNKMGSRVTYVGSPLQFNFGDAGDERGVMVLNPDTNEDRFIQNPFHDAFKVIAAKDLIAPAYNMESLSGCFVTVIYDDIVTEDQHDHLCKQLEACGVISVKKESVVEKAIREHTIEVEGVVATSAVDLVEPFVKSVLAPDSQLDPATTVSFGKAIITEVNSGYQNVADTGAIFDGDITDIFMTKFLGVNETIHITVSDLAKGIWYFEGENGAGKSSILEAIFWCYFGEFIRNDMKADDAVFDPHETGKTKDCEVKLVHTNGWAIHRFRKCAALGGTGVKVYKDGFYREDFEKGTPAATQQAIDNLLGTNSQNFVRSNIMGQNVTANFITGDEKKRRAMIEEMLGLERFDAYLEKTRIYKKTISEQLDQQDNIQKIRAGEIERSAGQVGSIDAQILAAEQQYQRSLDALVQWEQDNATIFAEQQAKMQERIAETSKAAFAARERWHAAVDDAQILAAEMANIDSAVQMEEAQATSCQSTIFRMQQSTAARQGTLTNIEDLRRGYANNIEVNATKLAQCDSGLALEPEVIAAYEQARQIRENASIADQTTAELRATAAALTTQANDINAKISRLSKTTSGECPSCTQPVDKAGLDRIVAGLAADVEVLRGKWKEANGAATKAAEFATQLRKDADVVLTGCPTLEQFAAIKTARITIAQAIVNNETELARVPAMLQRAEEAFRDRLLVDAPGYNWSSTTSEEVQKAIDTLVTEQRGHLVKAQVLKGGIDKVRQERVAKNTQETEQASNTADDVLATLLQSKAAIEAGNAATVAAKGSELAHLRATIPAADLKATKERLLADRTQALAELEAAKVAALALSQKAAYVVFWDRAFAAKGSMRAFLLDQSVKQLNSVVSGFIETHFGGRMTLTFNADLTYQQRYGRRSGGQRKWTDLAALFSIFELSRQRSRYRAHFLALDEVFDALDIKGRQAVLELIASIAAQVDRIFMITHVAVPGATRSGSIQAVMPDVDTGTLLTIKPT